MSCPYYYVNINLEDGSPTPFCDLDHSPGPNLDICFDASYENCSKFGDALTYGIKEKILAIVTNGIQNANRELDILFCYLHDETIRTNYYALYRVVTEAAMGSVPLMNISGGYESMVSYDFECDYASQLENQIQAQIQFLNYTIGCQACLTISERELNISVEDLNRIVEVVFSAEGMIGDYLACYGLSQLSTRYAERAMAQMAQVSSIVTSYIENLGRSISEIRETFIREIGRVTQAARMDSGSTLEHTNITWHF